MNDKIIATIRTFVPTVVSSFVLFMSARGFELDAAAIAGLEAFLVGLATATYYIIVRLLAERFPWVEILLGNKKAPTDYSDVRAV